MNQTSQTHYEGGDASLIYRTEGFGDNEVDAFDLTLGDRFTANQNWSARLIASGAGTWTLTNTQGAGMEPTAKTTHGTIVDALQTFATLANRSQH